MKKHTINRRKIYPYLFIAPAVSLLTIFKIIPIFQSAWLSMLDYNIILPDNSKFIGMKNFEKLLNDRYILPDLWHTVQYCIGTVIPGLLISLALALALSEAWVKFKGAIRAIIFIPYIISITIAGLIWSFIYNPDFGALNYILSWFKIPPVSWLGDPSIAMWSVVAMAIWKNLGYNIIIWTAGITSISSEYRDAAKIDGANYLQELWFIRIPLLKPTIMFLSILGVINSFQSFDAIYVMTQGGPIRSTEVIVYYLWNVAFGQFNIGYAAAISWLVFIILVVLSLVQMRLMGSEE